MSHPPAQDLIRFAWKRSDFLEVNRLLDSGYEPSAATFRHLFSPKNLGQTLALNSPHKTPAQRSEHYEAFSLAFLHMSSRLAPVLHKNPHILGDMKVNQSLPVLLSILCAHLGRFSIRSNPAESLRLLQSSISNLLHLQPSWSMSPRLSIHGGPSGVGGLSIFEHSDLLWHQALKLPHPIAQHLLDYPFSRHLISGAEAWKCCQKSMQHSWNTDPKSLLFLLKKVEGSDMEGAEKFCTRIALHIYNKTLDSSHISDWLSVCSYITQARAQHHTPMTAHSLIGAAPRHLWTAQNEREPYWLIQPQPFTQKPLHHSDKVSVEHTLKRAGVFLQWLDGIAHLCAQCHVEPMPPHLANPHVAEAYLTLQDFMQEHPHVMTLSNFPLGATCIQQAFHVRVEVLKLQQQIQPAPLRTVLGQRL